MTREAPSGPASADRGGRRTCALNAVTAVVLGVTVAACAQPPAGQPPAQHEEVAVQRPSSGVSSAAPRATSSPTAPSPSSASSSPAEPREPQRAGIAPVAPLEGAGFAAAAPGSDAPGRRQAAGPRIAMPARAPDLVELERLVREAERIARQQRPPEPGRTDGSVAEAVGSFSYRYFADGTLQPDRRWVADNITSTTVPILGTVTCHRVMLPQLRGALREVVDRGLAAEIHPAEYAGCYVPRFIGRDPANGLSLHSWGIAVDLNVPGNQRGTAGEIDRRVVAVFKRWGFAWGGDWRYTDPMHFELAHLVDRRSR